MLRFQLTHNKIELHLTCKLLTPLQGAIGPIGDQGVSGLDGEQVIAVICGS